MPGKKAHDVQKFSLLPLQFSIPDELYCKPIMDKFIVSARKYRPQTFKTVIGQSHITTTLKNAIANNQLAHAFLFCGPRGVGKTTCARILAKTINCENIQPDGEACNACPSCKSFNEGTSLNIFELDAASNNSVDDIRTLVEQVRFIPQAGKYKVYIVDEVHMLSTAAFNAFLKTLEEPPPYAIFILATTEKHKIIPTILSRCQIFDFKRITTADTVHHLKEIVEKENINAEAAALQVIAQKSEGCMRDALSILDKIVSFTNGEVTYINTLEHLNILDDDYYFKLIDYLLQEDLSSTFLLLDKINRKGFEGDIILNGFSEFIRNLLIAGDEKAAVLLDVVEGLQLKYASAAKKFSIAYLVSALNILNEAEINYKMARNKRLHLELTAIKLNYLKHALELTTDKNLLVKKKRVDAAIAFKAIPIQPLQVKVKPAANSIAAKLTVENSLIENIDSGKGLETGQLQKTIAEKPDVFLNADGSKKKLFEALQEKYGDRFIIQQVKEPEPLNQLKLNECWQAYSEQLQEKNKHSGVSSFKTAKLIIENDTKFIVQVEALMQKKFIEQERVSLNEHIQKAFNNFQIHFETKVEKGLPSKASSNLSLNSREKFEKIASKYPLVKELKDKLKLDIDPLS